MPPWVFVAPWYPHAVRIVAMADTHGYHDRLVVPDGDLLVHAGDITQRGSLDELAEFNDFLSRLPHRHKLVIAGNHDFCFQHQPEAARELLTAATYLQDEAREVAQDLTTGLARKAYRL